MDVALAFVGVQEVAAVINYPGGDFSGLKVV
jgi:hypothetical protein